MATWRGFIPASNQYLQYNSGVDPANGVDEVSISYSYKHSVIPAFGSTQSPLGVLAGAAGGGDVAVSWGMIYHEVDFGTGEHWLRWEWNSAYATWQSRRKSFADKIIWTTAQQNMVITLKRSTGAMRAWLAGNEMPSSDGTGIGFNSTASRRRAYTIGNRGDGSADFNGNIGRVTLWDRLLTQQEAIEISSGRDPALALYATSRIDHISCGTGTLASHNETSLNGLTFTQTNNPAVSTVPDGLYTVAPVSNNSWHTVMANIDE